VPHCQILSFSNEDRLAASLIYGLNWSVSD